jgi:hypothetical protein
VAANRRSPRLAPGLPLVSVTMLDYDTVSAR